MKKPEDPPRYEGETFTSFANVELQTEYAPPCVDFRADVYSAEKIPIQNGEGLSLEWVRRSVWLQVPLDQMWIMMSEEGGQVPLRIVRPVEDAKNR